MRYYPLRSLVGWSSTSIGKLILSAQWAFTGNQTRVACAVVTQVEPAELMMLKVPHLGEAVHARGMAWHHLPIADYSIPDERFEQIWQTQGRALRTRLCHGENILVHCKGGLGRAGMIAARLLVELGMAPEDAIHAVRRGRRRPSA